MLIVLCNVKHFVNFQDLGATPAHTLEASECATRQHCAVAIQQIHVSSSAIQATLSTVCVFACQTAPFPGGNVRSIRARLDSFHSAQPIGSMQSHGVLQHIVRVLPQMNVPTHACLDGSRAVDKFVRQMGSFEAADAFLTIRVLPICTTVT